jgi:hypothetical protein
MRATWTQAEAVELCRRIEAVCPEYGAHVALTGGCLYKDGPRKDVDILFYRVRQRDIDFGSLMAALDEIGIHTGLATVSDPDAFMEWCIRGKYEGKPLDLFFPDAPVGDYEHDPQSWAPPADEPKGFDDRAMPIIREILGDEADF